MNFAGINKLAQGAEIAEGEAQEAINCFFYDGRLGTLGARMGKTFYNTTAYADTVWGAPRLTQTSGSRSLVLATNDGAAEQIDGSLPVEATTGEASVYTAVPATPLTVTIANATASATHAEALLNGSIPAGSYYAFIDLDGLTVAGTASGGTLDFDVRVQFLQADNSAASGEMSIVSIDGAANTINITSTGVYVKSCTMSAVATKLALNVYASGTTYSVVTQYLRNVILRSA